MPLDMKEEEEEEQMQQVSLQRQDLWQRIESKHDWQGEERNAKDDEERHAEADASSHEEIEGEKDEKNKDLEYKTDLKVIDSCLLL